MKIYSTKFKDLKLISLKKYQDRRGDIVKIFNKENKNIKIDCFESYISLSKKGAVRGLHGQQGKYTQEKLIYCIQGKALDLAIDLRKNSKTYGKVFKKKISSNDNIAIFIPKGFVHGVISLENKTMIINYCSTKYKIEKEFGININSINIKLNNIKLIISKKDKNLPSLDKFIKKL